MVRVHDPRSGQSGTYIQTRSSKEGWLRRPLWPSGAEVMVTSLRTSKMVSSFPCNRRPFAASSATSAVSGRVREGK